MSEIDGVTLPFQHPFMLTLCGPSQSGKTYWIYKLLTHLDAMIAPKPVNIVFLYSAYQPLYDEMCKIIAERKDDVSIDFIDCNKGIPHISDIQKNSSENTLVILDDLMTIATSSKENTVRLDNFACRDAHHCNVSVIFTCQNLMYGNGKLRNSRVNSQYMVMFKNLADHRNMYTVAENKKMNRGLFANILAEINSNAYGYLLFDNCVKSFENTRVRTHIFPNEKTMIYDI